ncbi:hypothetical protein HPP92_024338 [Vanilla planifolia]|uniref:Uncharacterized protein n=1 Tax=Vanilla planifolia TaxID=51239 RepID=A0A835PJG6_VANPL|nr:hypothetical protein HPP92_024338 [Vanilla planifolia]
MSTLSSAQKGLAHQRKQRANYSGEFSSIGRSSDLQHGDASLELGDVLQLPHPRPLRRSPIRQYSDELKQKKKMRIGASKPVQSRKGRAFFTLLGSTTVTGAAATSLKLCPSKWSRAAGVGLGPCLSSALMLLLLSSDGVEGAADGCDRIASLVSIDASCSSSRRSRKSREEDGEAWFGAWKKATSGVAGSAVGDAMDRREVQEFVVDGGEGGTGKEGGHGRGAGEGGRPAARGERHVQSGNFWWKMSHLNRCL